MTDLADLLRPLLDRASPPPPMLELQARVARRRRRRRAAAAATALATAASVALGFGLASGSGRHATQVRIGQPPGTASPPTSVALPSGYSFDTISATQSGLRISGGVPTTGLEQCVYASVDESTLQIGPAHKVSCDDPTRVGQTVSVVTGSAGMGSENSARIASVDPATGKVSLGPVVFTYIVASDTGVQTAYGGGWMWVYEVDTSHGPEVLQVDTATGRVVDSIPAPTVYRPVLAANDAGLWIGMPAQVEEKPGADTLYRVAPGSHTAVTVIAGRRVVSWLQADPSHLWAGIATAPYTAYGVFSGTVTDETIWGFNGSDSTPAYAVTLGGVDYEAVVGDESDWLWTVRWPTSTSAPSSTPEPQQIVRINPGTGAQAVLDTLPPVLVGSGTLQGFSVGQAVVTGGNVYILEPPNRVGSSSSQYVTLTRLPALPA